MAKPAQKVVTAPTDPEPGALTPGGQAPTDPEPSGNQKGELEALKTQVEGLRKTVGKTGEELSRYKQAVAGYPDSDKLVHWMQKGKMPENSTPSSDPGDGTDLDFLVEKALIEGDTGALKEILKQRDERMLGEVSKLLGDVRRDVSRNSADTAVDRFFADPDVDSEMREDGSPFWEYVGEYTRANAWIEPVFVKNPGKALSLVYREFIDENGDPLAKRRQVDDLERKRKGSLGTGGVDFSPASLASLAKSRGQRKLKMSEIAEAREAARNRS